MFFDFPEIVIIFGVALVVLGPKKLPGTAAQIGRWVGRARAMARQFREQLEQEVNSVESALDTNAKRQQTIKPPASSAMVAPEAPEASASPETAEAFAEDPSLFTAGAGWPGYVDSEESLAPYGDPNAIPPPESESSEAQLSLALDVPPAAAVRSAAPALGATSPDRPAAADRQTRSHEAAAAGAGAADAAAAEHGDGR